MIFFLVAPLIGVAILMGVAFSFFPSLRFLSAYVVLIPILGGLGSLLGAYSFVMAVIRLGHPSTAALGGTVLAYFAGAAFGAILGALLGTFGALKLNRRLGCRTANSSLRLGW